MSNNNEICYSVKTQTFSPTKHTLILPHTCQFEKQRKSAAGDADAIEQESTSSVVLGNPLSAVRPRRARPESQPKPPDSRQHREANTIPARARTSSRTEHAMLAVPNPQDAGVPVHTSWTAGRRRQQLDTTDAQPPNDRSIGIRFCQSIQSKTYALAAPTRTIRVRSSWFDSALV